MIEKKIQSIRNNETLKKLVKTGYNKTFGFRYFELNDFIDIVEKLEQEQQLFSNFSITTKGANLVTKDLETSEIIVTSMEIDNFNQLLKGKNMHPFQELGAASTYYKKYLYMTLYNLSEECSIDADIIITAPIYEELNRLIIETNTDSQKLLQTENINVNLIDITKKQAFILMEKLLDKKRKLSKK